MIIDESKMNELIEKEIKEQVGRKLKQIGRETMKGFYKDVIVDQVWEFLKELKTDLANEVKAEVKFNKEEWADDVVKQISDKLTIRIFDALKEDDENESYYDWD